MGGDGAGCEEYAWDLDGTGIQVWHDDERHDPTQTNNMGGVTAVQNKWDWDKGV